ncbi:MULTISPECIES: SMI1/KNR4 family protein [unclassified Streptomyces]|uniref:SMI1/KNR4 family protein n=1 Tax=unclassified Streptomyces TaxID=2593676 RepID=UPI000F4EFDD3|nr:SMI1/KNR4 family protein [Streptomyces sp. A2-16]QUC56289.1 SMI1/KNR4 family protein [Streptomyces sp. A2-16]
MWREITLDFSNVELHDPASEGALLLIEERFGQPLPPSLRSLLAETDGINAEYGVEIVWSAERILAENTSLRNDDQLRNLYMPFDPLLFFGDNGGGDQFAFVRTPERDDVFVWDHETDGRNWIAPSLESFLRSALGAGGEDWYR